MAVTPVSAEREEAGRGSRLVLAISMFVTGGCGLVSQYILSTVSTYILGNSIEQFSVIIALTLLMMGLAGLVQKSISDRFLVEKFVATEIGLGLLCGFAPLAMYAAYANVSDHFGLVQYGLILAVGFLIGLEIPLAIRINEQFAPSLKANIANIWALDYVGSFVGALIWAFVLIRVMPLTEIGFVVGFTNLAIAALTLLYFWRKGHATLGWTAGLALGGAAGLMAYGFAQNRPWSFQLEQRLYNDPIVFATTTQYQRIVVTEDRRAGDLRLYLNGNLQFSSADEMIYHEQLVHPAMSRAAFRRSVLILGGGDGLALREVLKYPDVQRVTLVDLDPGMIELGRRDPRIRALNGGAFDDARVSAGPSTAIAPTGRRRDVFQETGQSEPGRPPRVERVASVEVFTLDAARFLDLSSERFDVILVDLPDPSSVELAKLYSREFYRALRDRLAEDGVAAVQATSPYHAREAFLCILRTMRAAGWVCTPYHDNVPSFGSWGWILASRRPLPAVDMELGVPTRYLTSELMARSYAFPKGWLESRETAVSTLMQPSVMDYYVRAGWLIE